VANSAAALQPSLLREFAAQRLPDYLVPAGFRLAETGTNVELWCLASVPRAAAAPLPRAARAARPIAHE